MELSELKTRIDAGGRGWYLFTGEETYLLRYYLSLLKQAVVADPFTETFNYITFDGARIDVARLIEAVAAPPMMSEYKLVVWTYADFVSMKAQDSRALDELLEEKEKYPYTVLAFVCTPDQFDTGNLPKKPSKLYNKYAKSLDIVEFCPSTDAQLLSWLKKHFAAHGTHASAEVLRAMLARCGHSMEVLHREVDKLCMYAAAHGAREVMCRDVEEVCSQTFESQTFALSNALLDADRAAAYAALRTLRAERADVLMVVGMMARTYAELSAVASLLEEGRDASVIATELKLNPFKVKLCIASVKKQGAARLSAALRALGRIDERMKTSGARPDFTELDRFVAGYLM